MQSLPSRQEQIQAWEQICKALDASSDPVHSIKGHPYFRLGVLHLLENDDERNGLEMRRDGVRPEDKAAYRLLAIVKDFFDYLRSKKPTDWESALLLPGNRKILIPILFTVYDLSLVHPLDMRTHTNLDFLSLITNDKLRIFAGENYHCVVNLLETSVLQGQHLDTVNGRYSLGRAMVGMVGGVLEAIWLDRLPGLSKGTLGSLLREAHTRGILQPGTRLAALSSLLCFMRNHLHPGLDSQRLRYFIDMNVAKGCKVALDVVISELLTVRGAAASAVGNG